MTRPESETITQSLARWRIPVGLTLDFDTLFPAFTNANLMRRFGGVGGRAFIKDDKIEASSLRTESCLKVNRPCVRETLQAPRT